jgi:hypothetical protein
VYSFVCFVPCELWNAARMLPVSAFGAFCSHSAPSDELDDKQRKMQIIQTDASRLQS